MKILLAASLFLASCVPKHMVGVDMNNLSGSPCVDGVIYNIKQAGCEVFYWGQTDKAGMKLRCTYTDHDSLYTVSSFYALPLGQEPNIPQPYAPWCMDTDVMVFIAFPQNEPEKENN